MRLSNREFRAMNNGVRQFFQRTVEFPNFQRMGLTGTHQDILEIGCGSGYGAHLLTTLHPRSYVGIDLMPEQIALADKRPLANAQFMVRDAADLSCFPDASKDTIVIFGVLHHISPWREVIDECYRVLRRGGKLFIEEPGGTFLDTFDRIFRWGHPGGFRLDAFKAYAKALGFTFCRQYTTVLFGVYCLQK